jgi:hypothetical protein
MILSAYLPRYFRNLEVKEVIIYAALDESAPEPIASRNSAEPGKPLIFFK